MVETYLDLDTSKKYKRKGKGKVAATKSAAASLEGANGSFVFLTAAEQRAQGKKEEKKAAEQPYSFLQDRRDVSSARYWPRNHLKTLTLLERWQASR